jgi:perosamine synthetase
MKNIPVYEPVLNGNEKKYVLQCLESTWISSKGEYISRFEGEFSSYLGIDYSTSVSNGTVALHLALLALGIGDGDEVITPTLTYIASVNAIEYVGASPVFVDSDDGTWNIDPNKIVEKITSKTKAIMVVHLYGNPCAMNEIQKICKKYDLYLIEDAAEAFGSQYKGQYTGTFGDVSTFSFFGNKTITTGEGGMVVSSNKLIIEKVAHLKNQGVVPDKEYWHDVVGFNYRMTNICAAIGVAQLENVDKLLKKKRSIAKWYQEELEGKGVRFQYENSQTVNSFWMVTILLEDGSERENLRDFLKTKGVETRPIFFPVHKMPVFFCKSNFPVAESLSKRGINLPSSPSLEQKDVKFICSAIIKFLSKCKSL